MKKPLVVLGGLLAFLVSTLCLGSATLDLLIAHSMHTRGSFHGTAFSISRTLEAAAVSFIFGLLFLALTIHALRIWLRANPPEGPFRQA